MNRQLKATLREILPRSIAQRRILGGPLRGHSLVTSWYDYPAAIMGRTERPLLDWFERNVRPNDTWLDIGAHYGYTALALCRLVGAEGRVYAFEPMIATAGCISRTKTLNGFRQLTVVPVALGSGEDLSIQILPEVRGMIDSSRNGLSTAQSFLASGLDWLWPRIRGNNERIDGVKIDVQGMEIEVLKGMRELLRQHKPKLAIELHLGVSRPVVLELLASLGYSRPGKPIEPLPGESVPQYVDDRSYEFLPDA
ncbi:MAG TPA: FkbM family methyltransferase [Edaphobacter sp.]|nr:FkbM family methyltransferase [Edaphobacter sp.]